MKFSLKSTYTVLFVIFLLLLLLGNIYFVQQKDKQFNNTLLHPDSIFTVKKYSLQVNQLKQAILRQDIHKSKGAVVLHQLPLKFFARIMVQSASEFTSFFEVNLSKKNSLKKLFKKVWEERQKGEEKIIPIIISYGSDKMVWRYRDLLNYLVSLSDRFYRKIHFIVLVDNKKDFQNIIASHRYFIKKPILGEPYDTAFDFSEKNLSFSSKEVETSLAKAA
ncbi:hypothetical protein ACFLQ1_01425 [Candidatus Auribacterota bacterium]